MQNLAKIKAIVLRVIQGLKGNELKGDKGDKGDTGARGPQGEKGDTGPQGERGPVGSVGPQGEKGDDGLEGPSGEKGEKGDKGDKGEKGDIPDHRWEGALLQFEKPDGTWGKKVNLRGPIGHAVYGGGGSSEGGGSSISSGISYVRNAYSSRFSQNIDVSTVEEALDAIFNFTYVAPAISLSATPNSTIREYGNPITSIAFTATTTKTTDPITTVEFYRGASLAYSVPTPDPAGGTELWTETTDIESTTTFTAKVSDGTSTTTSNSKTYTFVYPFYWGVGAQSLTPAQIQALTKSVTAKGTKTFDSSPSSEVFYFAYPKSYGLLSSILDTNSFETISDYTVRDESFTMLDATSQDYYIYEYNNPTTQTDFTNTFYF